MEPNAPAYTTKRMFGRAARRAPLSLPAQRGAIIPAFHHPGRMLRFHVAGSAAARPFAVPASPPHEPATMGARDWS